MSKLRNPFRMRASEKIESDANFLHIYSPSILELLLENHQESRLWNNVTYIHSSPGGGKTSLLRIFEPSVLNSIFSNQTRYKEIAQILKKLDVFDEQKNKILGVYLLCSRSFEMLEDMELKSSQKKRIFYSLLNSRIILATLKSILILKNKKFPEDLESITFDYKDLNNFYSNLNLPCSGRELYDWAAGFEEKIFSALDSFVPIEDETLPGHSELFAFTSISSKNFLVDDKPVCDRILFMLDDTHKLTYSQRNDIKAELIEKRGAFSLWISERTEVLEPTYTLDQKNIIERDFQVINIEKFFINKEAKISALLTIVAEKRAKLSTDNLTTFQENLSLVLNEDLYINNYKHSILDSNKFFSEIMERTNKFDLWFEYVENLKNKINIDEQALLLKQIEILINRDSKRQQMTLDFGISLEELDSLLKSELKSVANYFICKKYNIPYYYGFSNIVKLSSFNIEQFLSFSSELFERMLSNNLLENSLEINPYEQEKIIQKVVFNKWKSLSSIPYSSNVIRFLNKLGAFCNSETNKPNAPYAPGINGFAIKEIASKNLFDNINWFEATSYEPLVNVISTCVAFNLLEVRPTNQGNKGQTWNVYYLNRWLCVHFNLPLSYGGWRHKSPNDLLKWIK